MNIYKITSLLNLIIGVVAVLFYIYSLLVFQDFCFRVDEIKGCGFWQDNNLNIIVPSLFYVLVPAFYFLKKSKTNGYLNLLLFFATPILFALIVKSF